MTDTAAPLYVSHDPEKGWQVSDASYTTEESITPEYVKGCFGHFTKQQLLEQIEDEMRHSARFTERYIATRETLLKERREHKDAFDRVVLDKNRQLAAANETVQDLTRKLRLAERMLAEVVRVSLG